ncbi:uncharacterized protein N7473_005797 [Penicillium subrubescens]|uniref:uncharacterized protein n=1 Tax=Penicillium subrubescens TaxID=1316194 RepID=UPI0025450295|nr:uncharacterized protein N7473_005797 [Penicillium subrubescens]KAJ5896398.1 hypothetical protein N7473_005797 [Penicillium subrubescens]
MDDGTFGIFSYLVNLFSYLHQSLLNLILQPFGFFSCIISLFIENISSASPSLDGLESNNTSNLPKDPPTCETYTVRLQPQHDLDTLGVGASGQVYTDGDQIVLKTCRIFAPPSTDASRSDLWHYASDTLFLFNLLKDERTVLQLQQNNPHPHIIKATNTNQPEGTISPQISTPTSSRIRLYHDIADALRHLHSLGIVHADVRVGNVLFDDCLSVIHCDFSAASPCGQPNLVFPDLPLLVNGPSPVLSGKSDTFALVRSCFTWSTDSHLNCHSRTAD